MSEITLENSIIDGLSSKGVLAYVAIRRCDGKICTTAVLAESVRSQSGAMLEGLKELELAAPGLLRKQGTKWLCGSCAVEGGGEVISVASDRFRMFVDDLKLYWDSLTDSSPFSFTPADGAAIRRLLTNYQAWGKEQWLPALRFRWISVHKYGSASPTQPFHEWIPKLPSYSGGPLDRFGKPIHAESERHAKVTDIQRGNREAGSRFLDNIRRRSEGGSD